MAGPLEPPATRILELLADGEWHDHETLICAAAKTVAPGKAFRVGERERNRPKHRPNGAGARTRGDDSDSIASGARIVARGAFNGLVRHGSVERDGNRARLHQRTVTDPA